MGLPSLRSNSFDLCFVTQEPLRNFQHTHLVHYNMKHFIIKIKLCKINEICKSLYLSLVCLLQNISNILLIFYYWKNDHMCEISLFFQSLYFSSSLSSSRQQVFLMFTESVQFVLCKSISF